MTTNGVMGSKPGYCYMYAFRYAQNNPDSTLVHGTIWSPVLKTWMGHAWVEHGDVVYEPTTDKMIPGFVFNHLVIQKNLRKYTFTQTVKRAVETENYGPWEKESGVYNPLKKGGKTWNT